MSTNRTIPRAGRSTSLRKTRETLLIHTRRAWPGIRREVLPALAIFWVNLAACGLIFAALEADDNWFLGLYWSAVTGSTTGYGDVLPQSTRSSTGRWSSRRASSRASGRWSRSSTAPLCSRIPGTWTPTPICSRPRTICVRPSCPWTASSASAVSQPR